MDHQKFDTIAKALATGTSRRSVLRGLVAGAMAGILGGSAAPDSVNADTGGTCVASGASCARDGECCSQRCDNGVCTAGGCRLGWCCPSCGACQVCETDAAGNATCDATCNDRDLCTTAALCEQASRFDAYQRLNQYLADQGYQPSGEGSTVMLRQQGVDLRSLFSVPLTLNRDSSQTASLGYVLSTDMQEAVFAVVSAEETPQYALGVQDGRIVQFQGLAGNNSEPVAISEPELRSYTQSIYSVDLLSEFRPSIRTTAVIDQSSFQASQAMPLAQAADTGAICSACEDVVDTLTQVAKCGLTGVVCELTPTIADCALQTATVCAVVAHSICTDGPDPTHNKTCKPQPPKRTCSASVKIVDLALCPPGQLIQVSDAYTNQTCDVPCSQNRLNRRAFANKPRGGTDFLPACIQHDCCYQTCGADRNQCNTDFYNNMLTACDKTYAASDPGRAICHTWAKTYFDAVSWFGKGDFERDQMSVCECCLGPTGNPASSYAFVSQWGTYGTGTGQFDGVTGIALDGRGHIYAADFYNCRIQVFTLDGSYVTEWGTKGSGDGEFDGASGVAVDDDGNVYVTDEGNFRVQKFTSDGRFISKWGAQGDGDGQFIVPGLVAVDHSGNVYVTDEGDKDGGGNFTNNFRVQKFSADGAFLTKWGSFGSGDGQFRGIWGIAVDTSGDVYVVDGSNQNVQKFTADGRFLTKWGTEGSGDGQFDNPFGIAVDAAGYVYVADGRNYRVQKFDADGAFVTKWGAQGSGEGQFMRPVDVAVDSGGYVYVADSGASYPYSNRIEKFAPSSGAATG